ncbi:hypothetical protein V2H45_02345 [Tumidithrix elongata RA019]|uniref:Recombinase family protein n=1 Tax=Tumidithrix elongata BACA0141 TaxID=2716417 RepID=A0AAW9PYG2_9CYAN|nr:hypothetical protein [Tumidithrix elongata RA019]
MTNLWIRGGSRSGKSDRIVQEFQGWAETDFAKHPNPQAASQSVLVLSVDSEQRQKLSDRLSIATHGRYPVTAATPLSFFRDQVLLFFPLLMRLLEWKAQFPILLRVENEQELATKLWSDRLDSGLLSMEGVGRDRVVRRMLDLYLLAANSGKAIEQVPQILSQGMEGFESDSERDSRNAATNENPKQQESAWQNVCENIGDALVEWREFCWRNGLLTYGTITELFGKYLLPNPQYRQKLQQRYRYLIVDDADEFPAIACDLCTVLVKSGAKSLFTFNPEGSIRLGLGADPKYWLTLAAQCQVETLDRIPESIGKEYAELVLDLVLEPSMRLSESIDSFHSIDTISRAKLFRSVADTIATAIASEQIKASEIAIIAPGLDNIANYALVEILSKKEISILPLNDQRPLSVSAAVRSLLALMTLVYPNLGHLVGRDQVAEMLVSLSEAIDPVRAGLLADRCFLPHPIQPQLLPSDTFSEWNRFGYEATQAYEQIRQWIERQPHNLAPLLLLDRAIQQFLQPRNLSYDRLSTLQELIETAQYYWEIGLRLQWQDRKILEGFIQLIRQGTVTANPFAPNAPNDSVVLATIYQYRMARLSHRWQFWLDAGSSLWTQGGAAALFGAPLFLHDWSGEVWTIQDREAADRERLKRLLRDLCDRATERIYLCYSELSTNGQIQTGPLQVLADIATVPI